MIVKPIFGRPGEAAFERELARRRGERAAVRAELAALAGRARDAGLSGVAAVLDLAEAMNLDQDWPPEPPPDAAAG